jgi:hypothetical protein
MPALVLAGRLALSAEGDYELTSQSGTSRKSREENPRQVISSEPWFDAVE